MSNNINGDNPENTKDLDSLKEIERLKEQIKIYEKHMNSDNINWKEKYL